MDRFGRHDNKIIGLIKVGPIKSKLAFENEYGDKYTDYFNNTLISCLNKNLCHVCFGTKNDFLSNDYEKLNDNVTLIPLFNEHGDLRREIFGSVDVRIIEMHKGYKKNKVFYGICKENNKNIVVKYFNRDRLDISILDILKLNPLELVESEEVLKNKKLLITYDNIKDLQE